MRLALIPINPIVGDIDGNAMLISDRLDEARSRGVDLAVFPELSICGYPPKDLLLRRSFVEACQQAIETLGREHSSSLCAVIGHPRQIDEKCGTSMVANALTVFRNGKRLAIYHKRLLPTYDVFDEDRYFEAGREAVVIDVRGTKVGLAVCEDLWMGVDAGFQGRYAEAADPVAELAAAGAELIVSPSASPFVLGKSRTHHLILEHHAKTHGLMMASVNQLGGNDDLIFDGHSLVYSRTGDLVASGTLFRDEMLLFDHPDGSSKDLLTEAPDPELLLFEALVLGVRDYLRKTGFREAIIGLSGGIDSAVTAAVAAAALGAERVLGVSMPGKYSSAHSRNDARELADRLGMRYETIPIAPPFDGFREVLNPTMEQLGYRRLGERLPDLSEENLQARARGTLLMTLSNRSGALLLTTGNKSELAVGYCTLYGDMNGGLAVLSDVAKQQVYRLSRYVNDHFEECGFSRPPIPENTITKPPSAELAPDQRDDDSLPPYDILDQIIERYVELRQSPEEIVDETGFDGEVVQRIAGLIDRNEYKRKQAAIGLKVTSVAFGQGRRMPIAQRWRA